MNKTLSTILKWLVTLAMPFFLGFMMITVVVGPAYPKWAYSLDSFPADPYGFTQEQRLELALVAVDYLERSESSEETIFLLEEQIDMTTGLPLYNEREIGHMVDVKDVTDAIRTLAWIEGIVVVIGLLILLGNQATRHDGFLALRNGGIFTTAVLLIIALFILVAWNTFFVQFHELLFADGTWTFNYSDGLIRLFPETFWFMVGVIISGSTLLTGIIVAVIGWHFSRRDVSQSSAGVTPAVAKG